MFYKIEITKNIIKNFEDKFIRGNKNECWEWNGAKQKDGHGKFSARGKNKIATFVASRLSYFLHNGSIDNSLLVCHTCNNPSCVNPNHLYLGTAKDNYDDMIDAGTRYYSIGEDLSELTESDVVEIRRLHKNGMAQIKIAEKFNVGRNCIWCIVNKVTWKHL